MHAGSYLILGKGETVPDGVLGFDLCDEKLGIYRRNEVVVPKFAAPDLEAAGDAAAPAAAAACCRCCSCRCLLLLPLLLCCSCAAAAAAAAAAPAPLSLARSW